MNNFTAPKAKGKTEYASLMSENLIKPKSPEQKLVPVILVTKSKSVLRLLLYYEISVNTPINIGIPVFISTIAYINGLSRITECSYSGI